MFVQIIEGKTSDRAGLRRQFDRWEEELLPGATGYLGSTGGVADDGTVFLMARFESEAAAQANSDRAEQGAWWNETSKYFDGEVSFRNTTDTDSPLGGGSDNAGFVQVMQGKVKDRARLTQLEEEFAGRIKELRPDLLGSVRAWFDGDYGTEVIYFTSEAEARAGEAAMNQADGVAGMEEFMTLIPDMQFIDLKDPWLRSA